MCTTCGGGCPDAGPRFTQPAADPRAMALVGTSMAPGVAPTAYVRQVTPGLATYESLYTGLAPNGEPMQYVAPGTFPMVHPAGKGR